jgi:hypothetical protein
VPRPCAPVNGRAVCSMAVGLLMLIVVPSAASAANRPLEPLRTWGAETGRAFDTGHTAAPAVERRIAVLRARVERAGDALRRADVATRSAEIALTRSALDRRLARTPTQLATREARFFYLAYQAELERLAERAGLDHAPTGRPLTLAGVTTDADGDGIIAQSDEDDDGDLLRDRRDLSDLGWGVPDRFAARPATLRGFCIFSTEGIPSPSTVAEAEVSIARAARRGCRVPAASARARFVPRARTSAAAKPVTLAKLGFSAKRARIDGARLTVQTRAKKTVKATFEVLVGKKAVMKSRAKTIKKGKRSTTVRFPSAVALKTARLRVTVRLGRKKGAGTVALKILRPASGSPGAPVSPLPTSGPITPPTLPCDRDVDSDRDTIPDCQELEGYDYHFYVPSLNCRNLGGSKSVTTCGDEKSRRVTSSPDSANTDGDLVVVDGQSFELTDAEEWFLFVSGGRSDPSSKDSDSDGVPDVEERKRWSTDAGHPDSDSDGVERDSQGRAIGLRDELYDRAEIDGGTIPGSRFPTAPTSEDTDGDGASDTKEVLGGVTNPLVAELPEYRLTPAANSTFGVQIGESLSNSYALTNSKTTEQAKEESNSIVEGSTQGLTSKLSIEVSSDTEKSGIKVTREDSYSTSSSHESTLATARSDRTEAQQVYEDTLATLTEPTGTINAEFRLENLRSDRPLTVKNLGVDAYFLCARNRAGAACGTEGERTFLTRLTPVETNSFTLAASKTRESIAFSGTAPSNLLKALAANPSNISFSASGGDLYESSDGPNLLDSIGQSIPQSTGRISIDDGLGRVKDYSVAAFIKRDWGKPDASQAPATPLLDALAYAGVTATTRDVAGGKVLARVATKPGPGAIDRAAVANPGRVDGLWALLVDVAKPVDDPGLADQVRLGVGDTVILGFMVDADNDGLLDRQERFIGSSDTSADSDGDAATVPCASECPRGVAAGMPYASDYFEAFVGWQAGATTLQDASPNRPAYQVRSDPTTCDGDDDGSYDGPGACSDGLADRKPPGIGDELARGTDPVKPDTDGDGRQDGLDASPLQGSPPAPAKSVVFTAAEMATCAAVANQPTRCAANTQGATIESPEFLLCGSASTTSGCTQPGAPTGLYRLDWDLGTSTTRPGNGKEIQGRFEVLEGDRPVLRVDLDRDEQVRRSAADEREAFFFATSKPSTSLRVRFTNTSPQGGAFGTTTAQSVGSLEINEVADAKLFLDQSANTNLAGIAIPAAMLNGTSATRHAAGDADGEVPLPGGVTTGPTLVSSTVGTTYGISLPGLQIGWRARFGVRAEGPGTSARDVVLGVTASKSADSNRFGQDVLVDGPDGKAFGAAQPRLPMVQGRLPTANLAPASSPHAAAVSELFESGSNPLHRVAAVVHKSGDQAITLTSFTLDPVGDSVRQYVAAGSTIVNWLAAGFRPGTSFPNGLFGEGGGYDQENGAIYTEPDGSVRIETTDGGDAFYSKTITTKVNTPVSTSFHRWSVVSERTRYGNCSFWDTAQNDPGIRNSFYPLRVYEPGGNAGDATPYLDSYPGDNSPLLSFVPAAGGVSSTGLRIENRRGDGNCNGAWLRIRNVVLETQPPTAFAPGS